MLLTKREKDREREKQQVCCCGQREQEAHIHYCSKVLEQLSFSNFYWNLSIQVQYITLYDTKVTAKVSQLMKKKRFRSPKTEKNNANGPLSGMN